MSCEVWGVRSVIEIEGKGYPTNQSMFSEALSRYINDLRTMGIPESAPTVGISGVPGQGPYMRVSLELSGSIISEARFETYGCPVAIGCGSFLTKWAQGKTLEQVKVIEAGDLESVLGGLPLGKEHCATLAVDSLKDALEKLGVNRGITA